MKDELQFLAIGILFFLIAFGTSALLDLSWIQAHWIRESLTILLMLLELILGALILIQHAKSWKE